MAGAWPGIAAAELQCAERNGPEMENRTAWVKKDDATTGIYIL
jgi:hypothetical protein